MNTKNFKKHFKKGITPLLCALTIFNFCSINAFAYEPKHFVTFPFNEPYVSDYQGYYAYTRSDDPSNYYYMNIWSYNYIQASDGELLYPSGNDLSVSITMDDDLQGMTIYFQSTLPAKITLYQFNSYENSFVIRYSELLKPRILYSYHHTITKPYSSFMAKGKYSSISLNGVSSKLDVQFSDTLNINTILDSLNQLEKNTSSINTFVSGIPGRLDTMNSSLNVIRNHLTSGNSNPTPEDVSSSGITNVTNKEQELLNKNDSVSSDINNLQVDINPNAAAVTWDLVNTAVMSNTKVFTMFLSILTIGIIGLILNR